MIARTWSCLLVAGCAAAPAPAQAPVVETVAIETAPAPPPPAPDKALADRLADQLDRVEADEGARRDAERAERARVAAELRNVNLETLAALAPSPSTATGTSSQGGVGGLALGGLGSSGPAVSFSRPVVSGPLAPAAVSAELQNGEASILVCLEPPPQKPLRIQATLTVDELGDVGDSARVTGLSPAQSKCVTLVLDALAFAQQAKPSRVSVTITVTP